MKLEGILNRFIALGPKVYGGCYEDGTTFVKVKGFKNNPSLDQLENLLIENAKPLLLNQEKWFSSKENATIKVCETPYSLKLNNLKRELVYSNNALVSTSNKVIGQ